MAFRLSVAVAIVCICLGALGGEMSYKCGPGPRLTAEDFFRNHVDTSIPGLEGIPARMGAGDLAGAERIFARHVRSSLRPEAGNREWLEKT